jgi:YD repeat-containing protein
MQIATDIIIGILILLVLSYFVVLSHEKDFFSATKSNWKRFKTLPLVEKNFIILFLVIFSLKGGAKQDNILLQQLDSVGTFIRNAVTRVFETETESQQETFAITSFTAGTNAYLVSVGWPSSVVFTNDEMDVFGTTNLLSSRWAYLGPISITPSAGAVDFEIPFSSLTNEWAGAGFFRVATQQDSDGDGLSDTYERLVSLTNGGLADSEGDGLNDFLELFTYGTDALRRDTDSDGYDDDEEVLAGTNPTQTTSGASGTIRYYYDADDRLIGGYSGSGAVKLDVSPAGNAAVLHERSAP